MKELKDGSLYLLTGDTFEAVIFWPWDGWWGELEAILLARTILFPPVTSHAFNNAQILFNCAKSFKVLELSDLPLYIGWPYVSTKMIELLKGSV